LNDDLPGNLRPIVDFFGLVGTAPVIKDFHVVRAIRVIGSLDASPFTLVFGGGTALARAHKLVRRMSEDVDFKIVPAPAAPISRSGLRRALGGLRDRVTDALLAADFAFDSKDKNVTWSRDDNHYTVWHLPYDGASGVGGGLRATIKIELTYAALRQPPVILPVSSFVTEAMGRQPDVAGIACVSLNETAAEKLVGLTHWTGGMERLYGWPAQQAVGRMSHELLATQFPQRRGEIEADLLRDGQWHGELRHTARDRRAIRVASHWALQRNGAGRPASVVEVNTEKLLLL
jgi:hypothetical protein